MTQVAQLGATAGAVLAIAGVLLLAMKAVGWMRQRLQRLDDFLGDWFGEAARPGVPRRLGVMERLDKIEAQLHPDGGSTLRDKVDQIAEATVTDQT